MEFALARLQARFGTRPGRAEWQRLEGIDAIGTLLEAAKQAGLGRWLAGLDACSGVHRIEIALRERLRELIRELAHWMPQRWQAATLWTAHLIDFPALAHLARGAMAQPWMRSDPVVGTYLTGEAADNRRATLDAEQRAAMFIAGPEDGQANVPEGLPSALENWSRLWVASWPRCAEERASVQRILERLALHLRTLEATASTEDAPALRIELEEGLRRELRRSVLLPGAAFAYLAMAALDLERLRALIVGRVLAEGAESSS